MNDEKLTGAELAILKKIRDELHDDTNRIVYADWLDEHGNAPGASLKAEFLRLEVEVYQLCKGAEPVLQTYILALRRPRLLELRRQFNAEWLAVVRAPHFGLLDMDEKERANFWQADQERERQEREERRKREEEAQLKERYQRELIDRGWNDMHARHAAELEKQKREHLAEQTAKDTQYARKLAEIDRKDAHERAAVEKRYADRLAELERGFAEEFKTASTLKQAERDQLCGERNRAQKQAEDMSHWLVPGAVVSLAIGFFFALALVGWNRSGEKKKAELPVPARVEQAAAPAPAAKPPAPPAVRLNYSGVKVGEHTPEEIEQFRAGLYRPYRIDEKGQRIE